MNLKMKSYPCDEIQKIDVNCKIYKIRAVQSTNHNIEISWSDTVMRSLEIKQEHGTLTIVDHAAIGIYGTLALINLKADAQLLVKLPSNYTGKIIFQSKEEPVHISDLNSAGTIGISTNTGEILLESVCCGHLDIRGNIGKINCYSLDTTGTINISSKAGAILCNLLGSEKEYTVSCSTNNRHSFANGVYGQGSKKVQINSERGNIQFTFQNGMTAIKPSARYNRKNSFKEW